MRKYAWLLAIGLFVLLMVPASAAPLFGDVPDQHWARDAVANLAAKGFVEGYPDGTFKGDRAATRWELAMVVARFLAWAEQQHATFATKAEMEELRNLVNQLRDELDALGVRVTNLEENVAKIDKRVIELERITFYGELDTWWVSQGFRNRGIPETPFGFWSYNTAVGAWQGTQFDPTIALQFSPNVFPVVDYFHGRPLTNGTGFSSLAKLGVKAKISEEVDAGAEFAAFTSLGDQIVDAFYGVSAPYLSNNFTSNGINGPGGLDNRPWTRMTLDNFWMKYKPTKIKVIVGAFNDLDMDKIVYAGVLNPNINGPKYLDNYGLKVTGRSYVICDMDWEVFYTKLPDQHHFDSNGNAAYYNPAWGIDLGWKFTNGEFKVNYMRAWNDNANGNPLAYGAIGGGVMGAPVLFSYNLFGWVNPEGWFNGQVANVRNRPIYNPFNTVNNDGMGGPFGPQGVTKWGASFRYRFDPSFVRFFAEYGGSRYKPNMNASYSKSAAAWRVGLGATFAENNLDLDVEYVSVDPRYDPMILQYPMAGLAATTTVNVGGSLFTLPVFYNVLWRLPDFNYFAAFYQLHDSETYPNNRKGVRAKVTYRFADGKGKIWGKYAGLQQYSTSLYDVVYRQHQIAAQVPNSDVFGYSPGFIDPVFTPYYGGYYIGNNNRWFAAEDPRGKATNWAIGAEYTFPGSNLKVDASYCDWRFLRSTSLAVNGVYTIGGINRNVGTLPSRNHIDLRNSQFHIGLTYPFSEKFVGKIGYDWSNIRGHYDPFDIWWAYANANNSSSFQNINTRQSSPYLGFDYDISKNTKWGAYIRYYNTDDSIARNITGYNDFDWRGWQVGTHLNLKF